MPDKRDPYNTSRKNSRRKNHQHENQLQCEQKQKKTNEMFENSVLYSKSSISTSGVTLIRKKYSVHYLSYRIICHNSSYLKKRSFSKRTTLLILKHVFQLIIQCFLIFLHLYFQYWLYYQISSVYANLVDEIQKITERNAFKGENPVIMREVSSSLHFIAFSPWIQTLVHYIRYIFEYLNKIPIHITNLILLVTGSNNHDWDPFQFFKSIGLNSFWTILFVIIINGYLVRRFVFTWIKVHCNEIFNVFKEGEYTAEIDPENDPNLAWEEITVYPDLGIQHSVYSPPGILSFLSDSQNQKGYIETKFHQLHNLRNLIVNEAMYKMGFIYYLGFLVKGEEDEIILLFGEIGEWMRRWLLKYIFKDIRSCLQETDIFKKTFDSNDEESWIEKEKWFKYIPKEFNHQIKHNQSNTIHPLIERINHGKYIISLDYPSHYYFTY